VLYYALPEGQAEFRRRLELRVEAASPTRPRPVFDREVRGPWSRYATVWRVVYPAGTRDHFDPARLTFFW
jgi:hypothetical protein